MSSFNDTQQPNDPTPKSFFFHSPPDSPVNLPSTSANPFTHLTDTFASFAGKALSANPRKGKSKFKKASRPNTSDGSSRSNRLIDRPGEKGNDDQAWQLGPDPFASNQTDAFTRFSTLSHPNVVLASVQPQPKKRVDSLIFSSSEGTFFRGRTKSRPKGMPPSLTITVPEEVIDISEEQQARLVREQQEQNEREMLREAAARSIGLETEPVTIHHETEDESERNMGSQSPENTPSQTITSTDPSSNLPTVDKPLSVISAETLSNGHSRRLSLSYSTLPTPPLPIISSFPSTYSAISSFVTQTTTLPRYTIPHSTITHLLPRSRAWKVRLICLSAFPVSSSTYTCYLHAFKGPSPSPDNIELDRLEINEDSVVFVADEEVGGRGHVLRIGGLDSGAIRLKKERVQLHSPHNGIGNAMNMWFLHVENQIEMQRWIGLIKTIVLNRRAEAAGIGFPTSSILGSSASQGPGDIDVALTLRAQNLYVPNALPPISPVSPLNPHIPYTSRGGQQAYRAQSEASLEVPSRNSAVSILRGFFSSTTLPITSTAPRARPQSTMLRRTSKSTEDNEHHQPSSLKSIFRSSTSATPLPSKGLPPSNLTTHYEDMNMEPARLTFALPPSQNGSQEHIEIGDSIRQGATERGNNDFEEHVSPDHSVQVAEDRKREALVNGQGSEMNKRDEALDAFGDSAIMPTFASHDESNKKRPASLAMSAKSLSPDSGSGRVRLSSTLPEKLAPPSGPLPSPPTVTDKTLRETTSPPTSKRISNASSISFYSTRTGSASRLSTLFNGRLSQHPGRASMPPPPRPPPSFAPPPIPKLDGTVSDSLTFSPSHRRSGSAGNLPSMRFPGSMESQVAAPPAAPLPPIPTEDSNFLQAEFASDTKRLRLRSTPPPSPMPPSPPRIVHPFGPSLGTEPSTREDLKRSSPRNSLLSPSLTTVTAAPPPRRRTSLDYTAEPVFVPLSPPPRRSSRRSALKSEPPLPVRSSDSMI